MKYVLIKLFIGLVLFGTLVAMSVFNFADPDVKALCVGGLMGLGIMHLGSAPGADTPPATKEGGFARLGFIGALALASMLAMSACTTMTTQSTQVAYVQACATYNAAFGAAITLRQAGRLNETQIKQVTLLDNQITPICTGPLPQNPQATTMQITAAVATLAILESIKQEN